MTDVLKMPVVQDKLTMVVHLMDPGKAVWCSSRLRAVFVIPTREILVTGEKRIAHQVSILFHRTWM